VVIFAAPAVRYYLLERWASSSLFCRRERFILNEKDFAMSEAIPDRNAASPHDVAGSSEQSAPPEIDLAAEAVRRAEAELNKARELYDGLCQQATQRLKAVREKNVGDLMDGTLEMIRRHPGPGVILAGLLGFLLGRLFRR
jgi:hypothetical protein